jgi:hypothetical protein
MSFTMHGASCEKRVLVLVSLVILLSPIQFLRTPNLSLATSTSWHKILGDSAIPLSGERQGVQTLNDFNPTQADLTFNNDTLPTPMLRQLASNLGFNPEKEFLYVRNSIFFDPYYGSMKGAYDTLSTRAGNDADQASLLITLLRLSNIPARYVVGKMVCVPASQVENWVGFSPLNSSSANVTYTMAGQAASVLNTAGIPFSWYYSSSSSLEFNISHIWVEAFLNGTWVEMDPSFKQYYYYTPLNWSSILNLPAGGVLSENSSSVYALSNYMQESLVNYIAKNPAVTVGNALASSYIINATTYSLPENITTQYTTPSLINSQRWFLNVGFQTYSVTLPTSLLSIEPLFVYSIADSSTQNYINSFANGIYNSSINLAGIEMRPALLFNGSLVLEGDESQMLSSMPIYLKVFLNNTQVETWAGTPHYNIGEYDVLYVSAGHDWSPQDYVLQDALNEYNATANSYASGNQVRLDRLLGERFFAVGRMYFGLEDSSVLSIQRYVNVVQVSQLNAALLGFRLNEWYQGNKLFATFGGGFIDVQLNGHYQGISLVNDAKTVRSFNLIGGETCSMLEGFTIATTTSTTPISTISILMYAEQHGIPIVTISLDNYTILSSSLPQWVIQQIIPFLQKGNFITIPTELVNTTEVRLSISSAGPTMLPPSSTWMGTGWIAFDPNTLAAGYYISGYLATRSDGSTKPSTISGGGAGSTSPNNPLFEKMSCGAGSTMLGNILYCEQTGVPILQEESDSLSARALSDAQRLIIMGQKEQEEAQEEMWKLGKDFIIETGIVIGTVALSAALLSPTVVLALSLSAFAYTGLPAATAYTAEACLIVGELISLSHAFELGYYLEKLISKHSSGSDPSFDLYIENYAGATSGFKQNLSVPDLMYTQYYSGAASNPEELFLYELAPGSYDVSIVNSNDYAGLVYGTLAWTYETTSGSTQFEVQVPANSTMRAELTISYLGNSIQANLSSFLPASFITLVPQNRPILDKVLTLNGTLMGLTGTNALAGKTISLLFKQSNNITGSWTYLGSATTGSDGSFSFPWNAPVFSTLDILADYAGDAETYGSHAIVTLPIKAYLNVTAYSIINPSSTIAGMNFSVLGQNGIHYINSTTINGIASFLLERGNYELVAPSVVMLGSGSRIAFVGLEGASSENLTIELNGNYNVEATFAYQYYVKIELNPATGGSVSLMSGWFGASASLQATALANSGWQFEGWNGSGEGSYSGMSSMASAVVNSPLFETANFYPGLAITASSGTSVSYSYGSTSGSISAGTSKIIFVPKGTNVTITASPTSFIYSFSGWSGATTSSENTISIILNSPLSLTANYSLNYINIGILSVVVIVPLVVVVALLVHRKHGEREEAEQAPQVQTGRVEPPILKPSPEVPRATSAAPVSKRQFAFCPECGEKLPNLTAKFCPFCGALLSPSEGIGAEKPRETKP